jgi:hypothetical protein
MSRLIVIEPNLMLRYAVAAALTPDHSMQFFDSLPESSALAEVDALIVDAATLRLAEKPPRFDFKAIERWQVPTVWIDDMEMSVPAARADWVNLKPPLQRDQLLKALFECLNPPGAPPAARKPEPRAATAAKARGKKSDESAAAPPAADNIIELIEVVEDEEGDS